MIKKFESLGESMVSVMKEAKPLDVCGLLGMELNEGKVTGAGIHVFGTLLQNNSYVVVAACLLTPGMTAALTPYGCVSGIVGTCRDTGCRHA